ncbi:sensor histidine kinase [Winogradskyella sp. PG-2]|uniref:sensor histidine kinase n=1 Tax=Winogradskyella sp. PG-2 TaxID=754409 RepID=UPI00045886D8|nr:sensor histidine kinase [Winogradskyella sp. PG-2]BAO75799.1 putative two-component system sensor protein, no kinase domain [Winogradskyella sp. PG-2]
MDSSRNTYHFFNATFFKHTIFWLGVFLYFIVTSDLTYFEAGYIQLFHSTCKILIPQIITAYVCLFVLVPKFLNTKKTALFALWLIILLVVVFSLYIVLHMYLYEPKYYQFFNETTKKYAEESYWERITNFSLFFSKAIKFLTPTALLLMARFYKNQQKYLKLNEQKKTAELTALKHQLNPHFLFNTLNNLYPLALKKSDQTPEVIEKLSDMLDYMLYRTNETFVSLQKEIELIENYLSLEKVRYGKRVKISFENTIIEDVKIAPLLLLTFIENAFKHGVSQELKKAYITIAITVENNQILFSIENSKSKTSIEAIIFR